MRRFTRLTSAFSKKLENHEHAVALHFMYYNFCRKQQYPQDHPGGCRWSRGSRLESRRAGRTPRFKLTHYPPFGVYGCAVMAKIVISFLSGP